VDPLFKPKMNFTLRHIKSHLTDSDWLVNVLSLVAPDHDIFAKGFFKPTEPRAKEERMIRNNGFFDGIPELDKKGKTLRLET